jgi:hypothetical protein
MSYGPLTDVLNAFVRSGLAIEYVAELGDRPVPSTLAIRARKGPATCAWAGGERSRFAMAARSS